MISKILIANRGEVAVRIIKTCKKIGVKTVSVYSKADENSLHIKLSNEKVCIGENFSQNSYLNISNIIMACKNTNCDAIHGGYGFLSENAEFAKICKKNKIIFIGAKSGNISLMGNKSKAREVAERLNIPIIKGISNFDEKNIENKKIDFPVIIKASAGGGGKGMRVVYKKENLLYNILEAKNEAKKSFNDDDIYIEKFIENPRHIEIQVICDKHKNIFCLKERDCTTQRNYQKIIEETPCVFINKNDREKLYNYSKKICKEVNYEGVGTVEFLMDENKNFYFIEMNTRIQVEHTITEELYNIDIIQIQIQIANGEKISLENLRKNNIHVIECRVNAEDTDNNFIPYSGEITKLKFPKNIRIDTHIYEHYKVPIYYDSMLGKFIIKGKNRNIAIQNMISALENTEIKGIKTNINYLKELLLSRNF